MYKRILLKLSGEFLIGDQSFGLDVRTVDRLALEVKELYNAGIEICIVIGGGNIFRGISAASYGMHRAVADSIGMLATVMNSIAFQNSLEKVGLETRVMSAISMRTICEPYIRRKALKHLKEKRIIICAAGSGNPYFSTDTAATLRALEINAEVIIKATKVDGVYSEDPVKNPSAQFFNHLTYKEVLEKKINVMDHTAVTLAFENSMPILVCSLKEPGILLKVCKGEGKYSLITAD